MWDIWCRKTPETMQQTFTYVPQTPSGGAHHADREATEMTRKFVRPSRLLPQLAVNNGTIRFYLYCVGIVSWRFTDKNNVASFCSWLPAQIQQAEGKSAGTKTASTRVGKCLAEFVEIALCLETGGSMYESQNQLRFIKKETENWKKLRPSPAGSRLLVREVHWRDTVAQREVSVLHAVLSVLFLICP